MKIVFICGSLENGKDGVGDYTRRISFALAEMGNSVAIISCNDKFTTQINTNTESENSYQVATYRIPNLLLEAERFTLVKEYIDKTNPDWISLQFVLFAFDKKGLPVSLYRHLMYAGGNRKWHIMFHEIWVGTLRNSSLKLRVWGSVQRLIIKNLLFHIKPMVVHTQTAFYKKLLQKLYVKIEYLPLFSNIPVNYNHENIKGRSNNSVIRLVLFGAIHEVSNLDLLIEDACQYENNNEAQVILQLAGRNGDRKNEWTKKWTEAGLQVEMIGEQPADKIADVLSNAHIGLTTTAYPMIEKSGTVAAMLSFQLPVLSVATFEAPRNLPLIVPPFPIYEVKKGCIKECLQQISNSSLNRDVFTIANQFIQDLENSEVNKIKP